MEDLESWYAIVTSKSNGHAGLTTFLSTFHRIGVPSDPNCFVILPSGFATDVNCLPSPQSQLDTLLERSPQEIKVCLTIADWSSQF